MTLEKYLKPREFDEDRVQEASEILLEAEDIKKDSILMNAVQQFLSNKKKKITSLEDLKDKANNFSNEEDKEDDLPVKEQGHKFKEKKKEEYV